MEETPEDADEEPSQKDVYCKILDEEVPVAACYGQQRYWRQCRGCRARTRLCIACGEAGVLVHDGNASLGLCSLCNGTPEIRSRIKAFHSELTKDAKDAQLLHEKERERTRDTSGLVGTLFPKARARRAVAERSAPVQSLGTTKEQVYACLHRAAAARGSQTVRYPVKEVTYAVACESPFSVLEDLAKEGRIRGSMPWTSIEIVEKIPTAPLPPSREKKKE